MNELLILVDENDNELGVMDKLSAHQTGLLHRAFSIFIFNSKGEVLLQQRADEKYHSAGLWSNTCCSHPVKGEDLSVSINRRLYEEMGMHASLKYMFNFIYKTELEKGLTEHEFDHVYFGFTDDQPKPNPAEVKDWKYMNLPALHTDIQLHPENYSAWLAICLARVTAHLDKKPQN